MLLGLFEQRAEHLGILVFQFAIWLKQKFINILCERESGIKQIRNCSEPLLTVGRSLHFRQKLQSMLRKH